MAESGGNRVVVTTADGRNLAKGGTIGMREEELAPVLAEFHALPEAERKPDLPDPADAVPPKRPIPTPPENGLIVRGYCTYLQEKPDGSIDRKKQFYYKENPDAWAAETQSDKLWLTEAEWKALVPANPKPGVTLDVPAAVQRRFFSTVGIDYMEGSVNALPTRESEMQLTVESVDASSIAMSLTGHGQMGVPFAEHDRTGERSRGCELDVIGKLEYDRRAGAFTRFDLAGVGKAWGNKMNYTKRAIRIEEYPWLYGIACELVTGDAPIDRIPPYNLVHYGSGIPYFE